MSVHVAPEYATQALAAGDSVSLVGFGTFEVKSRAERIGRNPKTGEAMTILAARVPGGEGAERGGKIKKNRRWEPVWEGVIVRCYRCVAERYRFRYRRCQSVVVGLAPKL